MSVAPSCEAIEIELIATSVSSVNRRKSNRWQRPTIVAGILCGSVVASTNRTPRRRFLEDLQQRVEGLARQSLRLVDDVDLLAALHRGGRRLLAQLARVLDTAVTRGVDLDDVEVGALADRHALRARAAGLGGGALLAVDHLREDARRRGLAGAPRTAEQERVVQAVLADRAGEGAHDVVLPEHLGRRLRAVPPVQRLVLLLVRHVPPLAVVAPTRGKKVAVHPPSTTDDSGATLERQLQPGAPTAPTGFRLRLLPSGPDRVRGPMSRRTRPSTLRSEAAPDLPGLGRGFSPAEADRGYRAPLAPRLARPRGVYVGGPTSGGAVSSDVIQAAVWGFVAASALPLGALVAMRTTLSTRTVGAIMAFGAGTLISAVTFELVEQAFDRADLWPVVAGLGLGAVVFTAGDAALVRAGGRRHRDGVGGEAGNDGGLTIALGAVLDGVPESLVLGISLASGGAISITFLIAVFISNVPESLASTRGMLDAGQRRGRVLLLWVVVALVSGVVAAMGATLDGLDQAIVALVQSFAAGALLALIADSLLPDAYREAGLRTGLFVVLGFALAFGLTAFD